MRNPEVLERIQELHAENLSRNGVTVDSVLQNLSHDRQLARERGDISSAVRCDELFGKYMSMWSERFVLDSEQPLELDQARLVQCRQIASFLIQSRGQISDGDGIVPAQLPESVPSETIVQFSDEENEENIEHQFEKGIDL